MKQKAYSNKLIYTNIYIYAYIHINRQAHMHSHIEWMEQSPSKQAPSISLSLSHTHIHELPHDLLVLPVITSSSSAPFLSCPSRRQEPRPMASSTNALELPCPLLVQNLKCRSKATRL